jgi:hypothetical protein
MQEPKYSPDDEMALMSRLWSPAIKDNPLAFVNLLFPWGVKGTPLEHFSGPRKWQREAVHTDWIDDHRVGQQRVAVA